jgi:hypothetical protein
MATKVEDEKLMQQLIDALVAMPPGKIQSIPEIMGQFMTMSRESLVTWAGRPEQVMAAQFMAYLKGHGMLTEVLESKFDSSFKVMTDAMALCPSKASRVSEGGH